MNAVPEDRGSISILVAVVALGLLAMLGLVVDGAGKARTLAHADDVAAAAARCAAQEIDVTSVRAAEQPRVDGPAARRRAMACLTAAGMTGSVSIGQGGRRVDVTAVAAYEPVLLSAIGIGSMTVSGRAVVDLTQVQAGVPR